MDLTKLRSLHQDADMNFKSTKINLDTVTGSREALQDAFEKLQREHSKLKAQNENLQRDIYSKGKLLESIESEHQKYIAKLNKEQQKKEQKLENQIHVGTIEFEDLRSFCIIKFDLEQENIKTITKLEVELAKYKQIKVNLDDQIKSLNL